jgi:non-heme chloroperoxidase
MPHITVGAENSGPIDLCYQDHDSGQPLFVIQGCLLSGVACTRS